LRGIRETLAVPGGGRGLWYIFRGGGIVDVEGAGVEPSRLLNKGVSNVLWGVV